MLFCSVWCNVMLKNYKWDSNFLQDFKLLARRSVRINCDIGPVHELSVDQRDLPMASFVALSTHNLNTSGFTTTSCLLSAVMSSLNSRISFFTSSISSCTVEIFEQSRQDFPEVQPVNIFSCKVPVSWARIKLYSQPKNYQYSWNDQLLCSVGLVLLIVALFWGHIYIPVSRIFLVFIVRLQSPTLQSTWTHNKVNRPPDNTSDVVTHLTRLVNPVVMVT